MHFITTWTYTPERRDAVTQRFGDTGAPPPEGVTMVSRWHDVAGGRGFAVCAADDAMLIAKWCREWNDLLEFEITPVINDDQLGAVLSGA